MNGIVNEEKLLYSAYKESMKLAIQAIEDYLRHYDMRVYLVIYDKKSVDICKALDISVDEQIDDIYVASNDESYDELYEARMTEDQVYKKANIDRKLFSKIRSNVVIHYLMHLNLM